MRMRASWVVAVTVVGCVLGSAPRSDARNLRNTLGAPAAGDILRASLGPLGAVIGTQIANQIPTLSTSAGYTYEFNPQLDVYERSTKTFGPLFSERAVTVGRSKFNINASYTYIDFDRFNGHDIDHLTSRTKQAFAVDPTTGQRVRSFAGVFSPELAGSFSNLSPAQIFTQAKVNLDLEAQLFDLSLTYGVLEDLDVNIDLPLLRTFARSTLDTSTLDPRFASLFGAASGTITAHSAARESAVGIGDIRLRSKYLAFTSPVRMAGLLDLVLPTGSPGNFQGTGDTRLGTYAIFSDTFGDVFEPHLQAGVEFNCDDVNRSQAKYLAGVTAQVASFAALTVDFLGRSEFAPQGRIPAGGRLPGVKNGDFTEDVAPFHGEPVFVNIERYDIFDVALGGKVSITPQAIVFATVILPLNNDQGLRASAVPTVGVEATF